MPSGELCVPKNELDISATLECGQVFRFRRFYPAGVEAQPAWELISSGMRCLLFEDGAIVRIRAGKEDLPYFKNYFDLERPYAPLIRKLRRLEPGPLLKKALSFARGLRLLRQDKFETLIGFIISTNNNISRIRGIIERLCAALGERREGLGEGGAGRPAGEKGPQGSFFAFPPAEAMARAGENFYRNLGCGYRSPWLFKAVKKVLETVNLEALAELPTEDLIRALREFEGVGPKAADCIALFAYGRHELFPVDTWMKKAYRDLFQDEAPEKTMRKRLMERFGPYSGLAQQVLFYYYRSA